MEPLSKGALSDLIGSIYDCTLDPSLWEPTLIGIARAADCERAILSLNDLGAARSLINKSAGWEPEWLRVRERHLGECHAHFVQWFDQPQAEDRPFVASRELGQRYMDSSPFMQECLKPLGIVDMIHFFLIRTPAHFSELVLSTSKSQGIVTDRQLEIGQLLLPHLRRAVTISNVLDVCRIERERMSETLDALRCAVMLVDGSGRLLHANHSAWRLLRQGQLMCSRGGVLQAVSPTADRELAEAIARSTRDEAGIGKTGSAIRLSAATDASAFAHLLPLTGGELRTRLQPAAVAAVFVSGEPLEGEKDIGRLTVNWGLTSAEGRVVASLLRGHSLSDAAVELGIARTTAKSHLESAFRKTGVSRQADLVRVVLQSVPPT